MGGSPSLPADLERAPARGDAIYISANDHGARLAGADYIVAHDKIEERIRPFGVPLITRHMWGDYRILEAPVANTGVIAAWFARILGCAPIFIAGMGCWNPDEPTYHDRDEPNNAGYLLPMSDHVRRWQSMCLAFPAVYRPLGGPLAELMPTWPFQRIPVTPRDVLERDVAGVWVEFEREHVIKGRTFKPGEVVELRRIEAQRAQSAGAARPWKRAA